jgi:hypothetical protein
MKPRRTAALWLVVGLVTACSTTNPEATASGSSSPSLEPSATPQVFASASPRAGVLPGHEVLAGPNVKGTFDATTDGTLIVWSNGTIDQDAPELWAADLGDNAPHRIYASSDGKAILVNLAIRNGWVVFAEVTPQGDSRTWRLVALDPSGRTHTLDRNDLPTTATGILPMTAISDRGIVWATSHRGSDEAAVCELRRADLTTLRSETLQSRPCTQEEFWYPASDGTSYVYGTVEYTATGDDRHVYLVAGDDFAEAQRLDGDGAASWPVIAADTVVWKTAPREFNSLGWGDLVEYSITTRSLETLAYPPGPEQGLTSPSMTPRFVAGQSRDPLAVSVWDRTKTAAVDLDALDVRDPGFFSGIRIAGDLAIWFYTDSTQGGGTREIRWLHLSELLGPRAAVSPSPPNPASARFAQASRSSPGRASS